MLPRRLWSIAVASALSGLACNQSPSDLREWKPSDHDHTDSPTASQVDVSDAGSSPLAELGLTEVALVTWRQNCTTCHGMVGRGDGPQGPMVKPPDLTDPEWQARVTDEQITAVIRTGRGRMPAFQLPDDTVQTLVRLVRLLDRSRKLNADAGGAETPDAGSTAGQATAVPAGSAAAPSAGVEPEVKPTSRARAAPGAQPAPPTGASSATP